jgi:3-deoxy-D-manno-octulosonic acid kinase
VTAVLRQRGAPVPRPILVAGWRADPLWSGVFGTLHLEGALDGVAWLATDAAPEAIQAGAGAAARAVRQFHDAGGHHADLHVKNLMLREREDGPEVFLIDLDKARADAPPDSARRMRELMRLYRSLLKRGLHERVGALGRNAFLAAYVCGDDALGRALLSHLPREMRRVRRHARSYRPTP